ncbi:hypothetical protein AALA22_08755 [Anaerovoracaceae bacterium 41-7]
MEQLKTRIILRNDSHANWEANSTEVLLKGELGIEFLEDGKAKIKIGDGVSTWADLEHFGGDGSGSSVIMLADGKSIVTGEDGTVGLVGFAAATVGQVPRIGESGSLEWYTPLTADSITELTEVVNTINDTLTEHSTEIDNLKTAVTNVYTKAEVDNLVNMAEIKHVVGTVEELNTIENSQVGDRAFVLGDKVYIYDGEKWNPYNECSIEHIKIGGTLLDIVDKAVDIPVATAESLGVIKSSDVDNSISISADGTAEINSVSIDKLKSSPDTVIILNGGSSATV